MLVYGSNFFLIFLRTTVGIGHISSSLPITWFSCWTGHFPRSSIQLCGRSVPRQVKLDFDFHRDRNGHAVQVGRLVFPARHGLECGADQKRMAADRMQLNNIPVLVEHCIEKHRARHVRPSCNVGIFRWRRINFLWPLEISPDAQDSWRWFWSAWRCAWSTAENSSWNTSRHSA